MMHDSAVWTQQYNMMQAPSTNISNLNGSNGLKTQPRPSFVDDERSAIADEYMDSCEDDHQAVNPAQPYDEASPSGHSTNGEEEDAQEDDEDGDLVQDDHAESSHSADQDGTAVTSSASQPSAIEKDLEFLKSNVSFLNHQIMRLMNAMNVSLCQCSTCNECTRGQQKPQKEDELRQLLERIISNGNGHQENGEQPDAEMKNSNGHANALASLSGLMNLHESPRRGRKSKYCSPAEKKAVADYAQMHGASAAARKFNIPPPVAAYYHRKEYKKEPRYQRGPPTQVLDRLKQTLDGHGKHAGSPGTASGDDVDSMGHDQRTGQASLQPSPLKTGVFPAFSSTGMVQEPNNSVTSAASSTPHTPVSASFPSMPLPSDLFRADVKNVAHTTGSPGFLRGRGRGRPKLIGDELDAELVEYMVKVKEQNPHGRLTASNALDIARHYILEKAPGLLEEHGGHIKLKLTWAMKLVSRIAERQREIQLGLPAGSLSNVQHVTKSPTLASSDYSSVIPNHMFGQATNDFMNQNGNQGQEVTATPEILNVRELTLPVSESGGNEPTGEITSESMAADFANSDIFKNLLANMKSEDFTNHFSNIAPDVVEDAIQPASTAAF
ncbi:Protein ATTF-4 a [Aphelenchoides avenae]|nr:Protein ATTF-4 a [Aphelenchus avenae]